MCFTILFSPTFVIASDELRRNILQVKVEQGLRQELANLKAEVAELKAVADTHQEALDTETRGKEVPHNPLLLDV